MPIAITWLTAAESTTDSTRVSSGKTVFLTIAALSVRADAEREIPSWIAIHGRSPARRNSGKLANPRSTGTLRITEKTDVYRSIQRMGCPKAQSPPRLEPAYRTRTSRVTISFKRKAREAIPFFLLDIADPAELILSRFHAAIACEHKPNDQGHVF